MPLVLTPGVRQMVRHAIAAFALDHLYDLTKAGTVTGEDATGYVTRAGGVTHAALPCHYRDVSSPSSDPAGLVVLERPLLVVAGDDPSYAGDTVANIRTKDGVVLFAGPVLVESSLEAQPGVGGPTSKVLALVTEEELPR